MLKIIVNCGPAEPYIARCLASLRTQSFTEWQAFVTIDPCGDSTYREAMLASRGEPRIQVYLNRRRQFAMLNLIGGIERSGSDQEDVIVVLDGDDWLATPDALRIIHETYCRSNCWMTYGSWVPDRPVMRGQWPAYPDDLTDFRNHEWLGTAVRTWKRWLWDLIDHRDFRGGDGDYFRVTEDLASMLPMLEMSGVSRARHIADVLMVYNRSSSHAVACTRREEMLDNGDYIRRLPPYQRLARRPDSESRIRGIRTRRRRVLGALA